VTHQILSSAALQGEAFNLDGKVFSIEGVLIVSGESAYVDISVVGLPTRIPINDATLMERLLNEVPCYLGGEFLYRDSTRLVAMVEVRCDRDVVISKVESGVIFREGEVFAF